MLLVRRILFLCCNNRMYPLYSFVSSVPRVVFLCLCLCLCLCLSCCVRSILKNKTHLQYETCHMKKKNCTVRQVWILFCNVPPPPTLFKPQATHHTTLNYTELLEPTSSCTQVWSLNTQASFPVPRLKRCVHYRPG